ncbi:MAG: hypothetical protein HY782_19160 [Chloroflexi bacterium]|nr:hypothetical protein [Chloroflexota bacterium]
MINLSDVETPPESVSSQDQVIELAKELPKPPEPSATGNAQITVFKHALVDALSDPQDNSKKSPASVELAIGNVSDTAIAAAVFEALFYDGEGNILDSVRHREVDLPPGRSRAILIKSLQYESEKVASYAVRLVRATTTEFEKVQLRRQDTWTTETGEEAIHGIVRNVSAVKTDAAVVVTFYDVNKENIGTKVVLLRDIEPDMIRQYDLVFKPQEGDTVASYSFAIGDIV